MAVLNELGMKLKGEERVWKTILSKSGTPKSVGQLQIGQQLIMKEAIRLVPMVRDWINTGSSKLDRKKLREYFKEDEILLQKLVEIFLILSSTTHVIKAESSSETEGTKVYSRHRDIRVLNTKILPELTFDQTWRVTEVVVELSQYFSVDSVKVVKSKAFLTSIRYTCSLSESILEELSDKASEAFFAEPITVAPKEWVFENGEITGGYHHYNFQLVRSKWFKIDYTQFSQKIFDSVNYIQSTSWRINKEVVAALKSDLLIPKKEDFLKNDYPNDYSLPELKRCDWETELTEELLKTKDGKLIKTARENYFKLAELYNADKRDFESALGKFRAVRLAIGIAERYQDEEEIFFPHSFDFRGRVYPIPIGLSPQGSDSVKAMLEYSKGEVLNEVGEQWAWAYLASLYGDDKLDFLDRVERGRELIDASYRDADEPYQFLAHQLEMKRFLENPQYEFKGRVHLDACNSGSQFTSSITGDLEGCRATNVVPTYDKKKRQIRQDAYLLVSDRALAATSQEILLSKPGLEKKTLKVFKDLLIKSGRKVCKTPVMVSNYGGTSGGRAEIIWNLLRELGVAREWITRKNSILYGRIIGEAITGTLNGGKAFESYIQSMNNLIAKQDKPVLWRTSDGFSVAHLKKKELKSIAISCFLPGSRRATTITQKKFSEEINPAKMRSAIAPNYIHSLDAELLRRVALRMQDEKIESSDFIHDSFGCLPNEVPVMMQLLKEEFSSLMKSSPLVELDRQLREQLGDDKDILKLASKINIPNLGELTHEEVFESDWFFS